MSRLERWSRKKRGLESDAIEQSDADQASADTPGEPPVDARTLTEDTTTSEASAAEHEAAMPPPPGSVDHTLPDPETLPAGSDFSAFMVPGVSATLRRRALRRLWATGNYNVRDGLDDYDADYTQQLKPMANELAGKLRRWTQQAEEALDKREESAQDDTSSTDTAATESVSRQADACTSDGSFVQSASLDDQSDVSGHAPGERQKDS